MYLGTPQTGESNEMVNYLEAEPTGYRQLCEQLRQESEPTKFQILVEKINRVLTEYEKSAKLTIDEDQNCPKDKVG